MATDDKCPLTPALLAVLQACLETGNTMTADLARVLCRAPSTIRSEFHTICKALGVHSRPAALMLAMRHGWIGSAPGTSGDPVVTR